MRPLHITTPLLPHDALSAALGKAVLLKVESLQPAGSFKLRGIGRMCQRAVEAGARQLICPSDGNAAPRTRQGRARGPLNCLTGSSATSARSPPRGSSRRWRGPFHTTLQTFLSNLTPYPD